MGMINYLLDLLRSGPLSIGYPAQASPAQRGNRGTPGLDAQRCASNGACQAACPTGAISIERSAGSPPSWSIDYGLCIFCGACIQACPEGAIVADGRFELAVRQRGAAVVTHVLETRDA